MGNCCALRTKGVNPFHSTLNTGTPNLYSNEGSSADTPSVNSLTGPSLRSFSYADLKEATRNFRSKIGEGGFGAVYRGHLHAKTLLPAKQGRGMMVAIKKLNLDGFQGHEEWVAEVKFLGTLNHSNIVKLIGYCGENRERLLVYEYMSRGSLDNQLFRQGMVNQVFAWNIRMRVALGAARGLAFLHDAQQHIIYRDFKAANILLDEQYNPKLSDFGLAKNGPTGEDTHVSTRIMGTYGYAAPEYLATGHLTTRSDVYSFGVALLELLTGRRAMDEGRPLGEQKVVDWAKPYLNSRDRDARLMDPSLNGDYSPKVAHKVASIARLCVNEDARERPTMKEVVEALERVIDPSSK